MNVIVRPRRAGKTYKLVKEVLRWDGILLVPYPVNKESILEQYPKLKKWQVMTWKEYGSIRNWIRFPYRGKLLFIDNVEILIQECFKGTVSAVSMFAGLEKWDRKKYMKNMKKHFKTLRRGK